MLHGMATVDAASGYVLLHQLHKTRHWAHDLFDEGVIYYVIIHWEPYFDVFEFSFPSTDPRYPAELQFHFLVSAEAGYDIGKRLGVVCIETLFIYKNKIIFHAQLLPINIFTPLLQTRHFERSI